jgi:hypothetical protein
MAVPVFGSAVLVLQAANVTLARTVSTVLTGPVMVATISHEGA